MPVPTKSCLFFVPGRIEVVGKHTDYAGGRSLTCATEFGLCVGTAPRNDRAIQVTDLRRGIGAVVDLGSLELEPEPADWRRYLRAVAVRLSADLEPELGGVDIVLAGDLPPAAGMSSSSALVVAFYLALVGAAPLPAPSWLSSKLELSGYLGAVESGRPYRPASGRQNGKLPTAAGVGTLGGSEDHTAILCSRADQLRCYSYDPVVEEEAVDLRKGWRFAVAVSGVHAGKAARVRKDFNRLSSLAAEAAEAWRRESGREDRNLAQAVRTSGSPAVRETIGRAVSDPLRSEELLTRFDHFDEESEEVVPAVVAAFERGDFEELGRLVDRSQRLAEDKLGNQVAETVFLQRSARSAGAVAASAFGAGFGGSVWALVRDDEAEDFLERWRRAYFDRFPERHEAHFLSTLPGGGARRILS